MFATTESASIRSLRSTSSECLNGCMEGMKNTAAPELGSPYARKSWSVTAAESGSNPRVSEEDRSSASPSPDKTEHLERVYRVLLAEDNPGDVFLVRDALEQEHLPVDLTVKRDGEEMLAFLSAA